MRWFVDRRVRKLESERADLRALDKKERDPSITTEQMMDGVMNRAQRIAEITYELDTIRGKWELRKQHRNGDRT